MEKPKISIIVPVYNVENYLKECLDSILGQSFTDWECILVDDGSTDSSPVICDEYASQDSRFKVIHKLNGGVSSARNAGLKAASAEFIGFVDPDDWIEPVMFNILYSLIVDYDADIAQIGFRKEYIGRHSTKHFTNKTKVISGMEAAEYFSLDRIPNYLWNKLHRKDIITCGFPEGQTFEDIYVYGQWINNVRKMVLDPTPLYHYRMRKGSIVHSDFSKNRYDSFIAHKNQINLMGATNGDRIREKFNANIYRYAVDAAKIIARNEKDVSRRNATISKIKNALIDYSLPSIRDTGLKTWWRTLLLRTNPDLFIKIMRGVHFFDFDRKDRVKRFFD